MWLPSLDGWYFIVLQANQILQDHTVSLDYKVHYRAFFWNTTSTNSMAVEIWTNSGNCSEPESCPFFKLLNYNSISNWHICQKWMPANHRRWGLWGKKKKRQFRLLPLTLPNSTYYINLHMVMKPCNPHCCQHSLKQGRSPHANYPCLCGFLIFLVSQRNH